MNQSIALPKLHESRSLYLRRTVPNDASLLFRQGFCQRELFMRLFRLNLSTYGYNPFVAIAPAADRSLTEMPRLNRLYPDGCDRAAVCCEHPAITLNQ